MDEKTGENSITERIFEYDNFRAFLSDYFKEQKRLRSCFSHRYFARRAGLASPSFCLDVVKGKFNLTLKTIPRVIRGLGLRGRAATFFTTLVSYNQAKTQQEREEYYADLVRIREASQYFKLSRKHYEYFSHYRLSVIRELAVYAKWEKDYKALGGLLRPAISPGEARSAVDKLLELGLLEKDKSEDLHQSHPLLSTAGIPGSVQRTARREILKHGLEAMDTLPPDKRHISHATVSMSRESYKKAVGILDEARKKIVELAVNDKTVEQVFQVVLQAFPVSERIDRKGDGS